MACCVFTAYMMNKIIQSLESCNVRLIDIKYNDFDDELAAAVSEEKSTITTFAINGMTCAACTKAIHEAVGSMKGVKHITVSLPLGQATVLHDASQSTVAKIIHNITAAGYEATPNQRTPEQKVEHLEQNEELSRLRSSVNNATVLASIVAFINTTNRYAGEWQGLHCVSTIVGIWVVLHEARHIHESAWRALKIRHLTMNTLASLSLLLSVGMTMLNSPIFGVQINHQYISSGAYLATVILCGRYIDLLLRRKSAANFTSLYRLQANTARVQRGDDDTKVPAVLLQPQDEIILEPQDTIPVDSYILEGSSWVDQSVMTGESRPVFKTTGDHLLAGTRNISRRLVAVVTKGQKDSSLERLVDSITLSVEGTADMDSLFGNLISYFVSFILFLAVLGFSRTYTQRGTTHWDDWALLNKACERAMAILASACPCALGLATPTAVMSGIDAAWKRGVLVTNSLQLFNNLTRLTHVVVDKTGTLTEGKLKVVAVNWPSFSDTRKQEAFMLLCAVERQAIQDHPVASAIFKYALNELDPNHRPIQRGIEVQNFNSVIGSGITCDVRFTENSQWQHVVCGSSRLAEEHCLDSHGLTYQTGDSTGSTEAFLIVGGMLAAHIILQDVIRKEAPAVINDLKSHGLQVSLLTGDVEDEAKLVCSALRIPLLAARSTNKKQHIEAIQREGHVVAMIGDGFNDLAAQSQADVGIHLKLPGAASASASVAQMIILSPTLGQLPAMLSIAHMTTRQSKINMGWAIVYNICAMGLAMGLGEPWGLSVDAAMAGSMMALSSVTVMALSLHLRYRLARIKAIDSE